MSQETVRIHPMAHPAKPDGNRLDKNGLVTAMKQIKFQSRCCPMGGTRQRDLDGTLPGPPKAWLQGISLGEDNSLFALPHSQSERPGIDACCTRFGCYARERRRHRQGIATPRIHRDPPASLVSTMAQSALPLPHPYESRVRVPPLFAEQTQGTKSTTAMSPPQRNPAQRGSDDKRPPNTRNPRSRADPPDPKSKRPRTPLSQHFRCNASEHPASIVRPVHRGFRDPPNARGLLESTRSRPSQAPEF